MAGHSFHAPSGRVLKSVAEAVGADEVDVVFVAGTRGSMVGLWRNQGKRRQVLSALEGGARVLVLPSAGGERAEGDALANWIGAVAQIDPGITVVLNAIHPARGRQSSVADYAERTARVYAGTERLAATARAAYPDVDIVVVGGGFAASSAKALDESGALSGDHQVFRDRLGHGSELVYAAQGVAWAIEIYGLSGELSGMDSGRLNRDDLVQVLRRMAQEEGNLQ